LVYFYNHKTFLNSVQHNSLCFAIWSIIFNDFTAKLLFKPRLNLIYDLPAHFWNNISDKKNYNIHVIFLSKDRSKHVYLSASRVFKRTSNFLWYKNESICSPFTWPSADESPFVQNKNQRAFSWRCVRKKSPAGCVCALERVKLRRAIKICTRAAGDVRWFFMRRLLRDLSLLWARASAKWCWQVKYGAEQGKKWRNAYIRSHKPGV
jgi:hypothetical protein